MAETPRPCGYDSRTIAGVIRERFGELVFKTEIYKSVKVSEAELEGRPIMELDSRSPGAVAYDNLTGEIISRAESMRAVGV